MFHPIKEILAIFANAAGHSHEAAVQAVYNAGHTAGKAEATEAAPAAVPAGEPVVATESEQYASGFKDGHAKATEEFEAGLKSALGSTTTEGFSSAATTEKEPDAQAPQGQAIAPKS